MKRRCLRSISRHVPAFLILPAVVSCGPSSEEPAASWEPTPPFRAEEEIFQYLKGRKLPSRIGSTGKALFSRLAETRTGVSFVNEFQPDHARNALYSSGFSCGGVAIGDADGDGWPDLLFTGGPTPNKLYRNLGDFRFRDVTTASGLTAGGNPWSAGAAFFDFDGDGDLDLYVCNHESPNQLWVNDGTGAFTERAAIHGVDTVSSSLMPYFQDYDGDGDLDLFLLTNRLFRPGGRPKEPPFQRGADGRPEVLPEFQKYFALRLAGKGPKGEPLFKLDAAGLRNHLFRNDGIRFTDVSEDVGLTHRGHGLSALWWDYDHDGDPDLYVANDHNDPDHLYRNDDGVFTDVIRDVFPNTAWFSMGSDLADLDANGREDLFTLDMSGTDHYRQKTTMGAMSSRRWFLEHAEPRQYMRNVLLLDEGDGRFREAAYLAGLANSDWGWAPKLEDFDEDGRIDAFVTNGMSRNFSHSDHPMDTDQFIGQTEFDFYRHKDFKKDVNLAFANRGDLLFEAVSKEWGLDYEGMSFAAAHGDLDRDGDLDLVVANLAGPAHLYRNETHGAHRVLIKLKDPLVHGAQVTVVTAKRSQTKTLRPSTGYMSQDEPVLHFGLGDEDYLGVIKILWPDGTEQTFGDVYADQYLEITKTQSEPTLPFAAAPTPTLFREVPAPDGLGHAETPFDDYVRQPLLPHKLSQLGPGMAWADLDGNGLADLYLGGSAGHPGLLYLNHDNGDFRKLVNPVFEQDKAAEDMGALFFDYDGDGDTDLLVASGGVESPADHAAYQDRLYRNAGGGRFERVPFPGGSFSSGPVAAADFDHDGDLDLFIGGRLAPGRYPLPGHSRLLRNDNGNFADVTASLAPGLAQVGLVTSALWTDVDDDARPDLLLTTEWGPVQLFLNQDGKLSDQTEAAGLTSLTGWWTGIAPADFDRDGDLDYALGNLGLNNKYQLHVTPDHPYEAYYGAFDESSGKRCFVEATWEHGKLFPVRGRSCSSDAMPFVRRKYPTYDAFARATLSQIYTPQGLASAHRVEARRLESGLLLNDGTGRFTFRPFPRIAQIAPTFGIVAEDFNADGNPDLVLAQNFYSPQPETGRMDGGLSQFLRGNGDGSFTTVSPDKSGVALKGDARSLAALDLNGDGRPDLALARNDDTPVFLLLDPSALPEGHRHLRIHLQAPAGNPEAFGTRLTLSHADGSALALEPNAGGSYLSNSPATLTVGIDPKNPPTLLRIRHPDGATSTLPIPEEDELVILVP